MIRRELRFLTALWKANLLAALEYRVAFLSQILGMMLNNAVYFLFWVIFFDRFESIKGWTLDDMFVLFGIVAVGIGAAVYFFGNAMMLAEIIANGRLDYYLSLPRPVLLHTLGSRSISSGMGDVTYGLLSFAAAGQFAPDVLARFLLGCVLAAVVFLSFLVLVQSLAFWVGHAGLIASQAMNAVITFALYPLHLFDGTAKLLLFTVIPAAFVGAVPAEFVTEFTWHNFLLLLGAALGFCSLAISAFHRGLRRYESGSGIQVEV